MSSSAFSETAPHSQLWIAAMSPAVRIRQTGQLTLALVWEPCSQFVQRLIVWFVAALKSTGTFDDARPVAHVRLMPSDYSRIVNELLIDGGLRSGPLAEIMEPTPAFVGPMAGRMRKKMGSREMAGRVSPSYLRLTLDSRREKGRLSSVLSVSRPL